MKKQFTVDYLITQQQLVYVDINNNSYCFLWLIQLWSSLSFHDTSGCHHWMKESHVFYIVIFILTEVHMLPLVMKCCCSEQQFRTLNHINADVFLVFVIAFTVDMKRLYIKTEMSMCCFVGNIRCANGCLLIFKYISIF